MLVDSITNNNLNLKPESLHIVRYEGVVIDFNCSRAFLFGRANMGRFRRKRPLCACECEEKTKWCPTNKKWNKFIDGHQNRGIYHPNYKGKIEVYCSYCNALKKINRSEKQNKKHHFCNRKCYAKWQSENKSGKNSHQWKEKIIVHCDYCNKKKEISPCHLGQKKYFCNTKCMGKWMSENLVGKKHHNWDKVIVHCDYCDKSKEILPCHYKQKNYFCNHKCYGIWIIENRTGERNFNWKGGVSCDPYCPVFSDENYKQSIRNRDNNECQNPDCWGNYNTNRKLSCHHIDGNKLACDPWNLITLCPSCNSRAEGNKKIPRIWWQKLYQGIMTEKYGYKFKKLEV